MYFTWCWTGPHHTFLSITARDGIKSRKSTSKKISQWIESKKNWLMSTALLLASKHLSVARLEISFSERSPASKIKHWKIFYIPEQVLAFDEPLTAARQEIWFSELTPTSKIKHWKILHSKAGYLILF